MQRHRLVQDKDFFTVRPCWGNIWILHTKKKEQSIYCDASWGLCGRNDLLQVSSLPWQRISKPLLSSIFGFLLFAFLITPWWSYYSDGLWGFLLQIWPESKNVITMVISKDFLHAHVPFTTIVFFDSPPTDFTSPGRLAVKVSFKNSLWLKSDQLSTSYVPVHASYEYRNSKQPFLQNFYHRFVVNNILCY